MNDQQNDRDPSEPIGTPPGGGSWTWDVQEQAWVRRVPAQKPSEAAPASEPKSPDQQAEKE